MFYSQRKKCLLKLNLIILILFYSQTIFAEVPNTILFQGILKDNATGQLLNSVDMSMTFKIYNHQTDGAQIGDRI